MTDLPKQPPPTPLSSRQFYDNLGWTKQDGRFYDWWMWEDSREVSQRYQSLCRQRIADLIPSGKILLDAGSGPVQHAEYLALQQRFQRTILLDVSRTALSQAPEQVLRVQGSVASCPLASGSVDAVLCSNVINHIQKDAQRVAVEELIRVTQPGGRLVFVLYNPARWVPLPRLKLVQGRAVDERRTMKRSKGLYWSAPPVEWWTQFKCHGTLQVHAARMLFSKDMRRLLPDAPLGSSVLRVVARLEKALPKIAARYGAYYAITLDKHAH